MEELYCYECKYKSVSECGSCRYVYKAELIDELRKLKKDRVYLSESNRHKTGRKKKIDVGTAFEIKFHYDKNPKEKSYADLAKEYDVSKGTIAGIIKPKSKRKK